MHYYLVKISITIFIYFSIAFVQAQSNLVSIKLSKNVDQESDRNLLNAFVELNNSSNTTIEGNLEIVSTTESLYVLQNKPKSVTLYPNKSVFIAIKAKISNSATSENSAQLEAHFTLSNSKEKQSAFLPIRIKEQRSVKMVVQQTNLLYEFVGDSLQIPIQLMNEGNSTQTVTIMANYPEFVSKNRIENNFITLKAHSDSLLILKKKITREILKQDEFSITIRSLYQNGDLIGLANIRANPIKQIRYFTPKMVTENSTSFTPINQITASQQINNSHQNLMALYANVQSETNKGNLFANLDLNWWEQSNQTFIRNAWIGYKEKKMGFQMGNLSKFNDLNLTGIGIETFLAITPKHKIEAGFLEKTYSIIDLSSPSAGQSAWVNITNTEEKNKGFTTAFLFDNDTNNAIQKAIVSTRFSIVQKNHFSLQTVTAISTMFANENSNQKLGGSVEINLQGKTSRLFYNSLNYFSSGYFAGIKSGSVNLNESIHLNLQNNSFWFSANHLSFAPKNIKTNSYFPSEFSNTQIYLGASKRVESMFFSVSLQEITEMRKETTLASTLNQEYTMHSNRIAIGGNYFKKNHSWNLTFDGGVFTTNWESKHQFQFKSNFNYSWNFFNVTAYYQYNNF
ncbi:MAG: hypothetical protein RLZZ44_3, partial [Bacteroidota bacterium]